MTARTASGGTPSRSTAVPGQHRDTRHLGQCGSQRAGRQTAAGRRQGGPAQPGGVLEAEQQVEPARRGRRGRSSAVRAEEAAVTASAAARVDAPRAPAAAHHANAPPGAGRRAATGVGARPSSGRPSSGRSSASWVTWRSSATGPPERADDPQARRDPRPRSRRARRSVDSRGTEPGCGWRGPRAGWDTAETSTRPARDVRRPPPGGRAGAVYRGSGPGGMSRDHGRLTRGRDARMYPRGRFSKQSARRTRPGAARF